MASSAGSKKNKNKIGESACIRDPVTGKQYDNIEDYYNDRKSMKKEKAKKELKKQKAEKELKKEKAKKELKAIDSGSRSITTSLPPAQATKKKEYVKKGSGHEASGAGDDGRKGGDRDKDCRGGGGGGSGEKGDGSDSRDGKDEKLVFCSKCGLFIPSKDFEEHVTRVHPMDGNGSGGEGVGSARGTF